MSKSQWYIGAPNGVVLCVDGAEGQSINGRLYHGYRREALPVRNIERAAGWCYNR